MQRPSAALVLTITLLFAGPAVAGPIEDAVEAHRRGDYQTAYRLTKPLTEQGFPEAQFVLGYMHFNGQGVPQDYVLTQKWLNLAASRYPASEKQRREKAERSRDIVASKMAPAQIAEAQRLAREWQAKKER